MKTATTCLIFAIMVSGIAAGCGKADSEVVSKTAAVSTCPTCDKGKSGEAVWCDKCAKGYVDGKEVKCKSCFEGKTGKSVWCESCGKGYVNGKATTCKGCVDAALSNTECDACKGKKDPHEGHSHS